MNIQYEDEEEKSLIVGEPVVYGQPVTVDGTPMLSEDEQYQKFKDRNALTLIEQPQSEIVHKVVYGDTLEGLSLTYDVPIGKIRQRNNIESDSIYYLKEIVIPNPKYQRSYTEEEQQYIKMEDFMMHMSFAEKSNKTARFYLDENDWDVEKAVKNYREDLEWEKKHNKQMMSFPVAGYSHQDIVRKKNQ